MSGFRVQGLGSRVYLHGMKRCPEVEKHTRNDLVRGEWCGMWVVEMWGLLLLRMGEGGLGLRHDMPNPSPHFTAHALVIT